MSWQSRRLHHIAQVWVSNVDKHTVEGQPAVRLCNYTDVYKNETVRDDMAFMVATATPDQVAQHRLRPGDTVITKDSETADDIGIPAFVESAAEDLVCGYHLAIIRPDPELVVPRYLAWAMRGRSVSAQWEVLATGVTRVGLKRSDMRSVQLDVPSHLSEQRAIADFLDRETAQIDALIERQHALIDRLRERRSAVVSEAVLGGYAHAIGEGATLDARLAPLPSDWRRMRLSHLVSTPVTAGVDYSAGSLEAGDLRYLRTTDISSLTTLTPESRAVGVTPAQAGTSLVRSGDVLLTRSGSLGTSYFHRSHETMAYAGYLVRVRLDPERCNPRYFAWWTTSDDHLDQISLGATRSTIDNFSASKFAAMRVPLPPLDVQRVIADRLDQETAKIDALTCRAERFIDIARERRSELISATVTGQIDVRSKAAA